MRFFAEGDAPPHEPIASQAMAILEAIRLSESYVARTGLKGVCIHGFLVQFELHYMSGQVASFRKQRLQEHGGPSEGMRLGARTV